MKVNPSSFILQLSFLFFVVKIVVNIMRKPPKRIAIAIPPVIQSSVLLSISLENVSYTLLIANS